MTKLSRSAAVVVFCLGALAFSIAALSNGRLNDYSAQVILIVCGAMLILLIDAVQAVLNGHEATEFQLNFRPQNIRSALDSIHIGEYTEAESPAVSELHLGYEQEPYDPILRLALARVEIERNLRRICNESDLRNSSNLLGMADRLSAGGIIPLALSSAIRDVVPIANRAVHGLDLGTEQTGELVALGREVVGLLRNIKGHKAAEKSLENESVAP